MKLRDEFDYDPVWLTKKRVKAPLPDSVDVAIVGCGPAGLTLAAQLSVIGGVRVRIFDRKPGPLEVGQADGIACRSMKLFISCFLTGLKMVILRMIRAVSPVEGSIMVSTQLIKAFIRAVI